MLTPRHRALFEASLSALLLPSSSGQEPKGLPNKKLDQASRTDRPDPVTPPDAVEGDL